jgi:phosphatidylglycerol lysyltransferase
VGNPDHLEDMLWQFREFTDVNNLRCVFYQITDEHLPHYVDMGLSFTKLGEEGRVNLATFTLEGSQRASLRQARNKGIREGAVFRMVPVAEVEDMLPRFREISDNWLTDKRTAEKGFSLGSFSESYIRQFDCAVIEVGGQIMAFANVWKSSGKTDISIDLMRYHTDAPKGMMDFLFIEMMLWAKTNGYAWFSMGMAPLAGLEHHPLASQWHKLGNLVYRFGEDFYNFEGLRYYKAKYEPEWESRYLACKDGLQVAVALYDTSVLISGGMLEIIKK